MEAEVILDTDVIIDHLRRRPEPAAKRIFQEVEAGRITAPMTSTTLFELSREQGSHPNRIAA